jgi:hypothetical protein
MRSPQTLSEADRRTVAAWAADCAERVLALAEDGGPCDGDALAEGPQAGEPQAHEPQAEEPQAPGSRDAGAREAIARTRAFAHGESDVAGEILRRFTNGGAARDAPTPAAHAARKAAGQAAAVAHMGAHALGAAAYAAKAAGLAAPDHEDAAVADEVRWQLERASPAVRAALQKLPALGEDRSGPLGPGLLASGRLGAVIGELQAGLRREPGPGR